MKTKVVRSEKKEKRLPFQIGLDFWEIKASKALGNSRSFNPRNCKSSVIEVVKWKKVNEFLCQRNRVHRFSSDALLQLPTALKVTHSLLAI